MRRCLLVVLLLVLGGCSPRPDPEAQAASDEARVEAALGTEAYTGLSSAFKTMRYAGQRLLLSGDYQRLEELLGKLEHTDTDYGTYLRPSQIFSQAFTEGGWGRDELYEYSLARWTEHSPASKYPRLALIERRGRWLRKEARWKTMEQQQETSWRFSQMLQALRSAEGVPAAVDDPAYWEGHLVAAMLGHAPAARADGYLAEVVKRDPERWTAHALRAAVEHPIWKESSHQEYMKTVDRLAEQYGPEVYAVCAWEIFVDGGENEGVYRKNNFHWKNVKAGFEALLKKHPESRTLLGYQARLALASEQDAEARRILNALGEDWERTGWSSARAHEQACERVGAVPVATSPHRNKLPVGPERALLEAVPDLRKYKLLVETGILAEEDHFASLELLGARLRKTPLLRTFYLGLIGDGKVGIQDAMARCDRWDAMVPHSDFARVARAGNFISAAWAARGAGWASSVSDRGWEGFRKYLDEAAKLLADLPDDCACRMRITVAMGRGEPQAVVDAAVERARELDPESLQAPAAKAIYLLPRWHGSPAQVSAFFEDMMKERGDTVFAPLVEETSYSDAFLQELPRGLVQRGLKAAVQGPEPSVQALGMAARAQVLWGERARAAAALREFAEAGGAWFWQASQLAGCQAWAAGKPVSFTPAAEVVEAGQYANVLPEATKLDLKQPFPIVPYRSLGVRLRYLATVPDFTTRRVTVERPKYGKAVRADYRLPYAMRAGQEEVILWDIPDQECEPGRWLFTVTVDGEVLASQEFEMKASDLPPNKGLRLDFFGLVDYDSDYDAVIPLEATDRIPARPGTVFAACVRNLGKPDSQAWDWVGPPRARGGGAFHEKQDADLSQGVSTQFRYILEKPEELNPGPWRVDFTVDGRAAGGVPFVLVR